MLRLVLNSLFWHTNVYTSRLLSDYRTNTTVFDGNLKLHLEAQKCVSFGSG